MIKKLYENAFMNYDLLPSLKLFDDYPALPIKRLIFVLASAIICHLVFKFGYEKLKFDDRKCNRFVSLYHSIVACILSSYILLVHHSAFTVPESYCVAIPNCEYIYCFSLGYFLWDVQIAVRQHWGLDFVIHASFCIFIYSIVVLTPFGHRPAIFVLFYESSTIFLHSYTFAFMYNYNYLGEILRLLFAITFFISRIIIGTWVTYEMWSVWVFKTYNVDSTCVPDLLWKSVLFINLLFHLLNLYWFNVILSKVFSTLRSMLKNKSSSIPSSKDDYEQWRFNKNLNKNAHKD